MLLDNNKKTKQAENEKHSIWKIVLIRFSIFQTKNYTGQNILFDVAFLVQKQDVGGLC